MQKFIFTAVTAAVFTAAAFGQAFPCSLKPVFVFSTELCTRRGFSLRSNGFADWSP